MSYKIANVADRILTIVTRILEGLSILGLIAITLLLFLEIVANEVGISAVWIRELSQLVNIWIVMLMIPVVSYYENQFRIDYFVQRLPNIWEHNITKAGLAVSLLAMVIMTYAAWLSVLSHRGRTTPILEWSQSLYHVPLLIGGVLFILITAHIILFESDTTEL